MIRIFTQTFSDIIRRDAVILIAVTLCLSILAIPNVYSQEAGEDPDGDGILGTADACPLEAEDFNEVEDEDGCPEDPDFDGILGTSDLCPTEAEDLNGIEDEDGCPDTPVNNDPDGDGVLGLDDLCPTEAPVGIDANGDGCTDGSPDPDPTSQSNVAFEFETYTLSSGGVRPPPLNQIPNIITVTDQNANSNPATKQTIPITIKSTTDSSGISLTLTETGENTGIFRNDNLLFMTTNNLIPMGSSVTISLIAPIGNLTPTDVDTIDVRVNSSTDTTGFFLTLTETGTNTDKFTKTLIFSGTGPSGGNTINVSGGDVVSVEYGGESENALVEPNPNLGVGAIQAKIGDTITATYLGESDTATIAPGLQGGGGGGGLIRPGLVLNLLAGLGSGIDVNPPSLHFGTPTNTQDGFGGILVTDNKNSFPLVINGKGYYLPAFSTTIEPIKVNTGQDASLSLTFLEYTGVEHVALHFVNEDNNEMSDTDAVITVDKESVTKSDPQGILADDITFSKSKENNKYSFNFGFSFDEPGNRHLMITAWDNNKNSGNTKVFDAFAVSGNPIPDEGVGHMIYLDLGAFYITTDGILKVGEKTTVAQPVIEYDYPDLVGRTERHDGIMHENVSDEKAIANQVMSEKYSLDSETFSADEKIKPDDTRRAPQLSWSSVGHKIRDFTLTPEENKNLIKELAWQEHLKAQKILDSLYPKHHY